MKIERFTMALLIFIAGSFALLYSSSNLHGPDLRRRLLCHAVGIDYVKVFDPYDLKATREAIREALALDEPAVLISRRPCALLKYVKHNPPLAVDRDKSVGCKACMRIGCPAISIKDGKARVDETLCVGCGVCAQLCPKDAFESTGKEA